MNRIRVAYASASTRLKAPPTTLPPLLRFVYRAVVEGESALRPVPMRLEPLIRKLQVGEALPPLGDKDN